jgi:hypothetical protein
MLATASHAPPSARPSPSLKEVGIMLVSCFFFGAPGGVWVTAAAAHGFLAGMQKGR